MMKIAVLSSGSKGNCTFVKAGEKRFLLDAGRNCKYIEEALMKIGEDIKSLDYVLISHNHKDHVSALKVLLKKTGAKLLVSPKLFASIDDISDYPHVVSFEDNLFLDGINITSFKSSHDAPDSRNFIINAGGEKMAYVTDTGYVNNKYFKMLSNLDYYLFESNHDIEMLQHGPYPAWLKKRVLSDEGHLSNQSCAFYLTKLVGPKTKKIVLIHLSETNNLESLALETVNNTFSDYNVDFKDIVCARQNEITEVM